MSKLIKFEIVDIPKLYVVGKPISVKMTEENPIPAFWGKCFEDGTMAVFDQLKDMAYDDSYVGWMTDYDMASGVFLYIVGMLVKDEIAIPEGFVMRKIEPSCAAVGWIQGQQGPDVFASAHDLTQKELENVGHTAEGFGWCMELYNCPRYTTPDERGEIILDYYIPCKKK